MGWFDSSRMCVPTMKEHPLPLQTFLQARHTMGELLGEELIYPKFSQRQTWLSWRENLGCDLEPLKGCPALQPHDTCQPRAGVQGMPERQRLLAWCWLWGQPPRLASHEKTAKLSLVLVSASDTSARCHECPSSFNIRYPHRNASCDPKDFGSKPIRHHQTSLCFASNPTSTYCLLFFPPFPLLMQRPGLCIPSWTVRQRFAFTAQTSYLCTHSKLCFFSPAASSAKKGAECATNEQSRRCPGCVEEEGQGRVSRVGPHPRLQRSISNSQTNAVCWLNNVICK